MKINAFRQVPTLMVGDTPLTQSLAILEYLEETYPTPPLLPSEVRLHRHACARGAYLRQVPSPTTSCNFGSRPIATLRPSALLPLVLLFICCRLCSAGVCVNSTK